MALAAASRLSSSERSPCYLADRQEFDPDSHVVSEELLADLAMWLRGRGHREWSMELMTAQLSVHSEAREHRVAKIRLRAGHAGLSRRPGYERQR